MTENPIVKLRKQRGFETRISFSQKLALSLETCKLYEKGARRRMKTKTAQEFSRVLNVAPEELIAEYGAWKAEELSS